MTWVRRAGWAALAVLVLMVLAWLALPPLVRWQGEQRLSDALGRRVTIAEVSVRPWSLELTLRGVAIAAAGAGADGPPLLSVERLHADLQAASLWQGAPVLQALAIERPQLRVARTAEGRYDVDDLIAKFTPRADAAPSKPVHFALANLKLSDGEIRFDDRPAGRVHELKRLQLSLPFVSDLPAHVKVTVEPRLAFELNGAAFDSGAQATPFTPERRSAMKLQIGGTEPGRGELDLAPYLGYLPQGLPVRIERGRVAADVSLAFALNADGTPTLGLTGRLRASDVAVSDRSGQALIGWKTLDVPLRDLQPLARRLHLGAVQLDGMTATVSRDAQGRINLAALGDAPTPAKAPASAPPPASAASSVAGGKAAPPWSVAVDGVALRGAQLRWSDAATRPAAEFQLTELNADVKTLAWPMAGEVPLALSARIGMPGNAPAATIELRGQAGLQAARIDWTLDGLALPALAPYLAQAVAPTFTGRLAASGQVDWRDGRDAGLKLAIKKAQLDDFQMTALSAATAPTSSASQPATRLRGRDRPLAAKQLRLADVELDLNARTIGIGSLALQGPSVWLVRDGGGGWNAERWAAPGPSATLAPAPAPTSAPASAPPPPVVAPAAWRVTLRDLKLDDGQLRFVDERPRADAPPDPRAVRVRLSQVRLAVQGLSIGQARAAPARVQFNAVFGRAVEETPKDAPGQDRGARGAPVSRVEWKGEFAPQPLIARGALRLQRVPVHAFERYVDNPLRIDLARAFVNWRGDVSVAQADAGLSASAQGDLRINDFSLLALAGTAPPPNAPAAGVSADAARAGPSSPDELLRWQRLALNGIRFAMAPGQRAQLEIAQAEIGDFYSRLVVTEQGRINLIDVTRPVDESAPAAAAAPSAASAAAPVVVEATPLPIDIKLGGTKLVNGRIDFADRFVKPNYSAALTDLNGSLGALQSGSREMATLELRGRAEGSALLEITGQLNPFAKPLALDIRAKATDLELAPLSPYAGKYAGYAIERGKLSMDVRYRIDADGKLEADNQVVLNQLTFGDRIESPSATSLPVRLAVALLKDSRGVIDLNLPISGSLSDPQFSIWGLVGRVLGNLLVKAVSAPFALLSGLGGGSGGDPSEIAFMPGTATFAEGQQETLDQVAKALTDRPALTMTVTGASDTATEREAWRRAQLEQRLSAERQRELSRGQAAKVEPAPVTDEATRARLLALLYDRTDLPNKPRNLVGLKKSLPPQEMEQRLRDAIVATPEAMRELAVQRSLAVRDALIAKGLKSERLFLAAPKTDAATASPPVAASGASAPASPAAWTPRVKLALQTG